MRLLLMAILSVWLGSRVKGQNSGCLQSDVYPRMDVAFLQGTCHKKGTTACEENVCYNDSDTYEHHTCSSLPLCQDEAEQCYLVRVLPGRLSFPDCCRTQKRVCPGDEDYDPKGLLDSLIRRLRRDVGRR